MSGIAGIIHFDGKPIAPDLPGCSASGDTAADQ